MRIITIILLSFNLAYAGSCPNDVQVLTKGTTAPCDGILLSLEASRKADQNTQDLQYYKDLNSQLQLRQDYMSKEVNILDERLKLYIDETDVLSKRVSESKWEKYGYFALGILVTGLAVNGASQLRH